MRKILFVTVILFLDFLTIYPQDRADVEFQNYISNYENFNFDSLLTKKFDNIVKLEKRRYPVSKSLGKREIDFNSHQSKFEYYFPFVGDHVYQCRKYILHVFENSTNIIGIICIDVYSTKPDSIKSYFNETELNKYIANHDSIYCTKTTKSDFIMEFSKDELYGYCSGNSPVNIIGPREITGGGFGEYPKLIDKFREWLRSYNIELQTLAIDALKVIYEAPYLGFNPESVKKEKENDLKIIKHIKERNVKVWKCNSNHSIELGRVY